MSATAQVLNRPCKRIVTVLALPAIIAFTALSPLAALGDSGVTTDKSDYRPGSTVTITGSGFDGGADVILQVLHDGILGDNDTSGAHAPWHVTADANGGFVDNSWTVPLDQDEQGATLELSASVGGVVVGSATFTDSVGSYSLKWYAADPDVNHLPFLPTYAKLEPSELACSTPSGGTGRAAAPLANAQAYGPPAAPSDLDAVTSLEPRELALCTIVPFFVEISVTGAITPENGTITINPEWLTKTTSGADFGFDPAYGVYCAFVDTAELGTTDPGNNAKVDSFSSTTVDLGGSNERIRGTIQVSGLDDGDRVYVEIWVVLKCTLPDKVNGNVQTSLPDAHTGPVGEPLSNDNRISTGNQTIPLLQVQDFFTASADVSVTKSSAPICFGGDVTYTIVVTNNSTDTVANGIVATDTLGANQTFVSASGASFTRSGQVVTFSVGALSPGQSTTLTVIATPTVSGSVNNSVTVTAITSDPDSTNNTDSETATVNALPSCQISGPVPALPPPDADKVIGSTTTTFTGPASLTGYKWSISGDGNFATPPTATSQSVQVTAGQSGSFTLTLITTNAFGCINTCTKDVPVITPLAGCTVPLPAPPFCAGGTATFSDTGGDVGVTRTWSLLNNTSGASFVVDPPGNVSSVTVNNGTAAGGYTIQLVLSGPGGQSSTCPQNITVCKTTVTKGSIDTCYPTVAAAEAAAIAATTVTSSGCLSHSPPRASTEGTCSAVITVTVTDDCGDHSVQYNTKIDGTRPVIVATGRNAPLGCNPTADQINAVLGTATYTDNCGPTTATTLSGVDGEVISTGCSRSKTRTWNVSDSCGNRATQVTRTATWTEDGTGPSLTCPAAKDVVGPGTGAITGLAYSETEVSINLAQLKAEGGDASDTCGIASITYKDSKTGTCPITVTRKFTVKDSCNNENSCNQTITILCQPSLITDTLRCTLLPTSCNVNNGLRLIFTPDVQSQGCYKLNGCNPGQFYYNVFYTGTPGADKTFNVTLPYPFVTQGANPVEVYDSVTVSTSGGQTCLIPGVKISPTIVTSTPPQITLTSYSPQALGSSATIQVKLKVPATGTIFLAVHMDYGLKGSTGYNKDANNNAVTCGTTTPVTLVPYIQNYAFSVGGATSDGTTTTSCNEFKKNPGVGGGANRNLTLSTGVIQLPVANAAVKLTTDAKGTAVIATGTSDQDGWYMLPYKWTGKAATLYVWLTPPGSTKTQMQSITLKANGYVQLDFIVP